MRIRQAVLWVTMAGVSGCSSSSSSPPPAEAVQVECVAGCGDGELGGPARTARLTEPFGVDFDAQGNWYICEYHGQRITRVDPGGTITLFAGAGEKGDGGDGGPAHQAWLNDPHSLYIRSGFLYVADTRNHRARRINLNTGWIETVAGTGEAGFSGDGGPATAARFNAVFDLALTAGGQMYIADLNNKRVRRVDLQSGIVETVAGNGQEGIPEEGAAAAASPLVDPRAVEVDESGTLYILERRGNALRAVDRQGRIRTLLGPEEGEPPLNGPKHLCLDGRGNLLIADTENHLVRLFVPETRALVTIAGTGQKGDRLVPEDPRQTELNRPHGVYVDPSGALYISDSDNHRVLRVSHWRP